MFIDTHVHLALLIEKLYQKDGFGQDQAFFCEEIIKKALAKNVKILLDVGYDLLSSQQTVRFANQFPMVFSAIGIHPTDWTDDWRANVFELEELLKKDSASRIVGVGEIGIDLYRSPENEGKQQELFKAQLDLAVRYKKPVILHIRDQLGCDRAALIALEVFDDYKDKLVGVIHCYQQTALIAKKVIEYPLFIGVDAPVGYKKNNWLREALDFIPLERMLLETDAPFLPLEQFRGTINHSEHIPQIGEILARLKGVSLEEVARITTNNAKRLFHISF